MPTQHFIDASGTLSNLRRTPQGGFLVDATLARVGVMDYWTDPRTNPDKIVIRRYNSPDVLLASASAAAIAPVTYLHPKKFVDVHNYQKLAAGHVVGVPTFVDGHIKAVLAIQDAALIRAIEMGEAREVSMGYTASHDGTPGVSPSGEAYDEARTEIEWNHIAVVPAGRAGKTVRLMLDSDEIPEQDDAPMKLKINGVEVDVSAAQDAIDSYVAGLMAKTADLTTEVATLKASVKTAQDSLAVAQSDTALDAAFKVREDKKVAEKTKADKRERVAKGYPTIDLKDASDAFIDGLDAGLAARAVKDPEGLTNIQSDEVGGKPPARAEDKREPKVKLSSRDKMRAHNAGLAKASIGPQNVAEDSAE